MKKPRFTIHFSKRRLLHFVIIGVGVFLTFGAIIDATCLAQTTSNDDDSKLTAEILIVSLYAKTSAEKEYCVHVAAKRDEGILPNRILYAAYRYALKKEKDRRFIYFKKSLEKLCADEKIDLEAPVVSPVKSSTNPFSFFRNLFRFP